SFLGCERLVEVINYSDNFEVFKASEENGQVGRYAIWVYNGSETQQSRVSNDDGYIIYTDGNEKVLVGYLGNQKEMVVPDYVTQINTGAFMNDTNLTRVTMGDNLHTIQRHAFTGCKNLTSVTVGRRLKRVGLQAFDYCEKISAVHYYGTESDWKNIAIGDKNQKFKNAPRFYH
ncbi:MAG: leucine-rich repeat protein, partial [Clostridia bacterium]|nr:leucine-rich repeat protein [Clostridia bacterium]